NDQTYNGAVTLSAIAALASTAGNIKFLGTLDGTFDLTTTTIAGKATTFAGATGVGAALNSLSVMGAADLNGVPVKTLGGQSYGGAVTLSANAALTSTLGNIQFLSTLDGTFDLTTTTAAGNATTFAGATGAGAALNSLTVNGAADLNGDTVKTVNDQLYNGPVTLGADADLTSTAGDITFGGALDGAFNLSTNTVAGEATIFAGAAGVGAALNSIAVVGAADLNGGPVKTVNDQTYDGAVTLSANAALASTAGNIKFLGTLDGTFDLTTTTIAGKATTFAGATGVGAALNSLTVNGAADLNGGPVKTVNDQTYNGAATLSANAALASTAGNVEFLGTLDGTFDLSTTTAAGKATTFAGATGVGAALNSLTVNGTADLNGGTVKTVNDQTYNGPVMLGAIAALTSTAGNIKFLGALDGTFDLTTNTVAGKATTFAGATGIGAALNSLTVNGAADLNGGPVKTLGGQSYGGA